MSSTGNSNRQKTYSQQYEEITGKTSMKNPLNKRLFRDLKSDLGKYVVIFIMMTMSIGFTSGYLVAGDSMLMAYNEGFEKYNTEDGNFRVENKLSKANKKLIEEEGIKIYENFYIEMTLTKGQVVRVFKIREEVNKADILEGKLPENDGEIAIDRMFADNNKLKTGDTITGDGKDYKITGLIALSDYSTMFRDNNDMMFDASKFAVGVVTSPTFDTFPEEKIYYSYSWKYDDPPKEGKDEQDRGTELMKSLTKIVHLENFLPKYANQAIVFTGEDFGGDIVIMTVAFYMIVVIMAFVFSVTINNTIEREAEVIGTLRATGYTRGEMIRHYMAMPVIITFVGAIIGNIMGYTFMKDVMAMLYYHSYSLPSFVTIWNMDAFVKTTVVPIVIMIVITYFSLRKKLKLSPLRFIRRDLSKKGRKKAFRLSPKINFFTRFRMRVIFQNISNYIVLFFGILFANILLMFGLTFPAVLKDYQKNIGKNLFCKYQYILSVPQDVIGSDSKLNGMVAAMQYMSSVETENPDAEKFTAYSLETTNEKYRIEEISLYGIEKNSKYIDIDFEGSGVYISRSLAEKQNIGAGDTITLKEVYEDEKYTFKIDGVYDYMGGLTIFMPRNAMNGIFKFGDNYFSGYLSDSKITDIEDRYIGTVIEYESITSVSRQLLISMGSFMDVLVYLCVIIFMVLIYLLTKVIIERNTQSISMAKILGYTSGEVSKLYVHATTYMVILFVFMTLPISDFLVDVVFKALLRTEMNGWFDIYIPLRIKGIMVGLGVATYSVVALIEMRKVKRVPMEDALKYDE